MQQLASASARVSIGAAFLCHRSDTLEVLVSEMHRKKTRVSEMHETSTDAHRFLLKAINVHDTVQVRAKLPDLLYFPRSPCQVPLLRFDFLFYATMVSLVLLIFYLHTLMAIQALQRERVCKYKKNEQ